MRRAPYWIFLTGVLQAQVVISQIYGGGGNAGAILRNDYVELFNRGTGAVDVSGWSVQYAGATGATWQVTPLSGVILPGRYYLVQQAAGAGGTMPLPRADVTGEIAMSATAVKVALVGVQQALEGSEPSLAAIVDLVGYGIADFGEGAPARAPSNTSAYSACVAAVLIQTTTSPIFSSPPAPRNGRSPATDCGAPPPAAEVLTISQIQGSGGESGFLGRQVETSGWVTARRRNGFYVESLDPDAH
jgi:predicted extracellular nuclease